MLNGSDGNNGSTNNNENSSLSLPSSSMNGFNNGNMNNGPSSNGSDSTIPVTGTNECKVWKNPCALFRGAEYQRLTQHNGKEPLTFHDMNLSAQEHQTFFSCDLDEGKPEYESKIRILLFLSIQKISLKFFASSDAKSLARTNTIDTNSISS